MKYRAQIRRILLFTAVGLGACVADPHLDDFVREFTVSVYEDSEFYRAYANESDYSLLVISRKNMTDDFRIVGWDFVSPEHYEYRIEFSNGAYGLVSVSLQGNSVKSAALAVRASPMQ